jgi:LysR family transcriptional regulator, cell division regulator
MDVGDLTVFAAVARAGGISKAAETLHTVQSNVTQRIRLIEHELGVPLFHRHPRGVTLTSAGELLLPYADRLAKLLGEAKQAASNGPVPQGRIVIGALETATAVRLPPLLAAYARECPAVDIEIVTGTAAELIAAVIERRVEAAFVAGPVEHPELTAHPVVNEELVLVTSPVITSLDQLAASARSAPVKVIVFRAGCAYRVRLENVLAAHGVTPLRHLEFGTLEGIIGCVSAGLGVTLLPHAVVAAAAADGRVNVHRLPDKDARATTVLVLRLDAFVSTALGRFVAMADTLLSPTACRPGATALVKARAQSRRSSLSRSGPRPGAADIKRETKRKTKRRRS